MNIFVLDKDPHVSAEMMCDKHIPKMIVESFQMMGSAVRRHGAKDADMPLTQAGNPLKGGYKNHPCTLWSGETRENYMWLSMHAFSLCYEFSMRFGKTHACCEGLCQLNEMSDFLPNSVQTPFALAMPDEFKCDDAVLSYRNFYKSEKRHFAKWEKGREAPYWWN